MKEVPYVSQGFESDFEDVIDENISTKTEEEA